MERNWITTVELIALLKTIPGEEKECRLYLGEHLGATHYWYWDNVKNCLMHTRDWPFDAISEKDVLEYYGSCKWLVEQ